MGGRSTVSRQVVLWVWAIVATGLVSCEVAALATRGGVAGIGQVLTRMSARSWSLVVSFVVWMWLGWHFFAR